MSIDSITTAPSSTVHLKQRIAQSFVLIWLDANIDESAEECQNMLARLRSVVTYVNIFTQPDGAMDFLTEVHGIKVFLIVEGTIGQRILSLIHDIPQLNVIYILCNNQSQHEKWTKHWTKIKGVHTDIELICEALKPVITQCNQDSIAMSFVPVSEGSSNVDLNQLEPSFMYTQLFKEILFEIEQDERSVKNFTLFWHHYYMNSTFTSNIIAEFERDYCSQSSIRWYTREYFIYQMLNQALRMLDADTMINMGFFIRDLHQQIQQLHQKQVDNHHGRSFIVYRGQGLSKMDFEKMLKTKGGLISFNNFLSTSDDRDVSLGFAIGASTGTDMVGILFKMTIDPSISSTPFASIREVSHFKGEEEILFSMHTIFRVEEIHKIDNDVSLYQVDLTLTADDDQELRTLTESIRKETMDETGWKRLGHLLVTLGQLEKSKELYNVLLQQTSNPVEKAFCYDRLGYIEDQQGNYKRAIEYHENALAIGEKTLCVKPALTSSHDSMGSVYENMGEYSKALSFYEKALAIREKILPANHPDFAYSNNRMGLIYGRMGEYPKAALFHEKVIAIQKQILPGNHPNLAASYSNMGLIYIHLGEYSKATSFLEKALAIREKTLPAKHPDFAISYNNLGTVCEYLGEHLKALLFHEKALAIREETLPAQHPVLAVSYNNMSVVYTHLGEYSKAVSFYEKAVAVQEKTFPANHPAMATFYNNMGLVYGRLGEYSKAVLFQEKALTIQEKTLSADHPDLAVSYSNIGFVYDLLGEHSKAVLFHKKALAIQEQTLPANHPVLAASYQRIGLFYSHLAEYPKAVSFLEKALAIDEQTLSANHSDLATSYSNMGLVYSQLGEYSKALCLHDKALEIEEKTLSGNHPQLAITYHNMGFLYEQLREYPKALSFYEKGLAIQEKALPANHPNFATCYNNMGLVYSHLGEHSKAVLFHKKALAIREKTLPANHPQLATSYHNISFAYDHLGEYSKALSCAECALQILQKSLPANHPKIETALNNIEMLKRNSKFSFDG